MSNEVLRSAMGAPDPLVYLKQQRVPLPAPVDQRFRAALRDHGLAVGEEELKPLRRRVSPSAGEPPEPVSAPRAPLTEAEAAASEPPPEPSPAHAAVERERNSAAPAYALLDAYGAPMTPKDWGALCEAYGAPYNAQLPSAGKSSGRLRRLPSGQGRGRGRSPYAYEVTTKGRDWYRAEGASKEMFDV